MKSIFIILKGLSLTQIKQFLEDFNSDLTLSPTLIQLRRYGGNFPDTILQKTMYPSWPSSDSSDSSWFKFFERASNNAGYG